MADNDVVVMGKGDVPADGNHKPGLDAEEWD